MPKVTVIVPVYNCERYIAQALFGLVRQDLDDIEIIILDNHSTDASWEIISDYAKKYPQIVAIRHEQNIGQGRNVNAGLEMASGEYIAEHDSDDFAYPEMYRKLYEAAKETNAEVVKCGFFNLYGKKAIAARQEPLWFDSGTFATMDLPERERFSVLAHQCHLQSGIVSREFLTRHNLRYRPDGVFEDTSLSFKIRTLAQRYTYIPDCLYFYRKDNPGSGSATIKSTYGICEQYDEITRFAEENHIDLHDEIETLRFYSYLWGMSRLCTEEERLEFAKRAGSDFRKGNAPRKFFLSDDDYSRYKASMERAYV